MVRAMSGVKMMDKYRDELMDMLRLNETMEKMAKANRVRWYGHVLRREDGDVSQKQLKLDVRKKSGRPKII